MTDAERAALVERIAQMRFDAISGLDPEWNEVDDAACPGFRDTFRDEARAILAAIEPAIRADERARVVAEAVSWHEEGAVHSEQGLEYSSLVGIPICNADELAQNAKWHRICATAIRAALGVEL